MRLNSKNQEVVVPVNELEREAIAISARAYRVPRFMAPRSRASKDSKQKGVPLLDQGDAKLALTTRVSRAG
jgi:hypothetical protein